MRRGRRNLRWLLTIVAGLLSVATHAALAAVKPGDQMVVVKPAELKSAEGKITKITPGAVLTVEAVADDSLKVVVGKVGRIDPAVVLPPAEALKLFSAAIEKNPQDADAWLARGKMLFFQGQLVKAIADLDESLKLAPNSEAHTLRGFAWKRSGDKEKAMADFDKAIELDPANAMAWRVRGATFASKGEHAKQLANYSESIRLDPDSPENLHHRAVVLSACTDDKIRNGKQAIEDATKASTLTEWKNPLYITMLAAAYAETGDFESAIKWEQKANELAGRPADAGRVEQYRQKEPFRTTWR